VTDEVRLARGSVRFVSTGITSCETLSVAARFPVERDADPHNSNHARIGT